ncbi:sphingosine kinase 1 isoform X2 [Jatropha curcas]|uniref:sphingosine kinase 1 isoform X2 n=1 Tax=Jatropha curcas TaxID=180498 RepID=UPI0009D65688|nr:sphingosine kinase 1 isoform X2 [Jatropha curcas]
MDESESTPELIMSDRVTVNGTITELTLTADGKLQWTERGQRCLTIEKEVLGFVIEGAKIRIKAIVDSGDGICCGGSKGALVRKDFVFQSLHEDSPRVWCHRLRDYIDSLGRPKRLFIFVNPFGGNKSATKVFLDVVKPLLEDADIQITVQETKHQLHAKEVASTLDLTKYDGIVCVSGDGILVEVVNGLLAREDWSDAIKVPLGMVPAGTGNGMVKSLLDSVGEPCKPSNAILAIIRGHKCSLDVATILQGETKFFSVLMLSWGLVADVDIESEKYRWMGSIRLDFYNICNPSQEQPVKAQQRGYQGSDADLISLDWRTISGPFVSIWLHNVPWGGEDIMAAPDAKFSDGYLDLILIKECPKLPLLKLMTEMSSGGHVKSPYVIYIKVKAFILEPGPRAEDPTKGGIIDVDGEVLARGNGSYKCEEKTLMVYDKLQITVDKGLATLFSPA